jgi:hypothetical protein
MPVLILIAVVGFAILATQAYGSTDIDDGGYGTMQSVSGKTPNRISPQDILQFAYAAGFDDSNVIDAVAVALAESGGNVNAYNPEVAAGTPTGLGSYGLWQIYEKAHPEFQALDLTDPQINARAAFSVYSHAGRSFHPWSTWKHGTYTAYLAAAQGAYDSYLAANGGSFDLTDIGSESSDT